MNLKRILATAIVWIGCAIVGVFGLLVAHALVNAFIADWPISLHAILAIPGILIVSVFVAVVAHWAWQNKWKP